MLTNDQPRRILRIFKSGKLIDRIEDPQYIPTPGTHYHHYLDEETFEKLYVVSIGGTAGGRFKPAEIECHTTSQ